MIFRHILAIYTTYAFACPANARLRKAISQTVRRALSCAACGATILFFAATTPVQGQCTWQELATLTASDAATDDSFGFSVAVSGDTAVVGAYSDEHAGGASDGSAYIFVRSGPPVSEVWTQQAKLTASDAAANDQFGNSVAISGDTVVVGSHFDDLVNDSFMSEGSAYVFVRFGTVWIRQAKLIASDAAGADDFGFSVALSGDTALIGAYRNDIPGAPDGGSAYIFVRAGTNWTEQAMLTASDEFSNDAFGASVSLSGDTAVVGMHGDEHSGLSNNPGSAYVFVRAGAVWTSSRNLLPPTRRRVTCSAARSRSRATPR